MASAPPMEGDVSRNQALEDTRYFPGKSSLRDRGRFSREITSLVCPRQRPAIPCLSTGQGQRGEGQSKVEGTSLEPPPSSLRCHCLLKPRRQSASDYFHVSVETARTLLFVFNASPSSSIHPFLPAPPRMSLPPKPREDISRGGNCR